MASGKILIVDDDRNICELLRLYIEKEGFETAIANDGKAAVQMFDAVNPDLILLDIMLPELDGWQVCREIRKKSQCPIIMLTAKGEVFDKVLGLELGADDYVVKPFGIMELQARVKAVLRRVHREDKQTIVCGTLCVDPAAREVTQNGEKVELTYKEFELLRLLAAHRGVAFSRDDILQTVWGYDYTGETRTVDMHVKALRQKLGDELISTVRGVGYKMN